MPCIVLIFCLLPLCPYVVVDTGVSVMSMDIDVDTCKKEMHYYTYTIQLYTTVHVDCFVWSVFRRLFSTNAFHTDVDW